jgi:hypothetical protein
MMNPGWPKRIDSGHAKQTSANADKKALPESEIGPRFWQARKRPKMFRAGLYARISTNDQQTLSM